MKGHAAVSAIAGGIILLTAATVMVILFQFREPPAEASTLGNERTLAVEVVTMEPQDLDVTIRGLGEVRPWREVSIAPEVSGSIRRIHPNLVQGGLVAEGEVLLEIDTSAYEAVLDDARTEAARAEIAIARLATENESDVGRRETLARSVELARSQFGRAKTLLEQDIGNQSDVDRAEQSLNEATDNLSQLDRQIAIYPALVAEAEQALAAANSKQALAARDLARTQVVAPFSGRVTSISFANANGSSNSSSHSAGIGHYATAGVALLSLSDDSNLEISVNLDSRDARRWLRFSQDASTQGSAWFGALEPVDCEVRWSESDDDTYWGGTMERVERFDPGSRTLTVAVRVPVADAVNHDGLPLVAGMFCEVSVPGRTLRNVFAVPRAAVTVDDTVYVSRERRLVTVPVKVVRAEHDVSYVESGLEANDLLVTTRLISPLEHSLLDFVSVDGEAPLGS